MFGRLRRRDTNDTRERNQFTIAPPDIAPAESRNDDARQAPDESVDPGASTLFAQRAFDAAADSAMHLSGGEKIELAAAVRERATEWFGAHADSEEARQALADADEQYAQTVVDADPKWFEETFGPDVDDPLLSAERNAIAERVAHVRFGREDLTELDPGLTLPVHGALLREVQAYQQMVGMVMPAPELGYGHQYGIGM
jgi:hypothetical protein